MNSEQLNASCCQKGCKGSHNHASGKSGAKPQQWEEFRYLCVQFTKASLSVCQHLPEGYRHDDFLVSLYLPQHWAISPDSEKTDRFLLTWSWPDRICPTVPTRHLSRSSMVRAAPQGRAVQGAEGDLSAGRATPSPTRSHNTWAGKSSDSPLIVLNEAKWYVRSGSLIKSCRRRSQNNDLEQSCLQLRSGVQPWKPVSKAGWGRSTPSN